MEQQKIISSHRSTTAAVSLAAIALLAAATAVSLTLYHHTRISELEENQRELQILVRALAHKSTEDFRRIAKRSAEETDSDADNLLSELSIHDLSGLRGPPGRDGRDGRDCSLSDVKTLISSLTESPPSTNISMETSGGDTNPQIFDEDELLQRFNESIGYALLRGIRLANSRLAALESGDGELSTTSSEDRGTGVSVDGGSTYVRWGKTSCANTSQIIYEGFAAGQHYTHTGGASNYQCLPIDPEFSTYLPADTGTWIYGAEYETGSHIFPERMHNRNVPCARCYAESRSASLMIPARVNCPDGWTKEYSGYLMAGHHNHKRAYAYECMDKEPEALPGLHGNANGALFYFVQASCGSIGHCPPYIESAELTCVVCTK